MLDDGTRSAAERLIGELRARGLTIATAESLTGGLIAAALTAVAGASDVVDRGFVTYTNAAKVEMLGVSPVLIAAVGVVSREVAIAMAEGALARSGAGVTVAVTGVAGPGGGTMAKPVGLVHVAAARRIGGSTQPTLHQECRFGAIGRDGVRRATLSAAFGLVHRAIA